MKVGLCPPECDKRDLMHDIGSTLGGLVRVEDGSDFCHIKVWLDVQNPLRRGIFVKVGYLGHSLRECDNISEEERNRSEDEQPYSIALKVKSNIKGKENFWLNLLVCKSVKQSSYVGVSMSGPSELSIRGR